MSGLIFECVACPEGNEHMTDGTSLTETGYVLETGENLCAEHHHIWEVFLRNEKMDNPTMPSSEAINVALEKTKKYAMTLVEYQKDPTLREHDRIMQETEREAHEI